MAFKNIRAQFRTYDPDRGWEFIWLSGEEFRLEHSDGQCIQFRFTVVKGDRTIVEVSALEVSGGNSPVLTNSEQKALIVEALVAAASGARLDIRFR